MNCGTILCMSKSTNRPRNNLGSEIIVGIIGLILSIALHELFHVVMHWGYIRHIELFPNLTTIVQVDVWLPPGYDLEGEEVVAYGITLLVAIITVMIIFKMRDTNDGRSPSQILFPKDNKMQRLSPAEMLKLSGLDEIRQPIRPSKRKSRAKK